MGIMTLADLRTDVESALGARGFTDPQLDRWINAAYYAIAGGVDLKEMDASFAVTGIVGTFSYTGPTDSIAWLLVFDSTNDEVLERIDLNDFYRRARSTNAQSRYWSRQGDNLLLDPPPDATDAFSLIYKKSPTVLSGVGDVTLLPAMWDQAIFLLSVAYGQLTVGEENRATFWNNQAAAYIGSRITENNAISGRFDATQAAR